MAADSELRRSVGSLTYAAFRPVVSTATANALAGVGLAITNAALDGTVVSNDACTGRAWFPLAFCAHVASNGVAERR